MDDENGFELSAHGKSARAILAGVAALVILSVVGPSYLMDSEPEIAGRIRDFEEAPAAALTGAEAAMMLHDYREIVRKLDEVLDRLDESEEYINQLHRQIKDDCLDPLAEQPRSARVGQWYIQDADLKFPDKLAERIEQ